MVVGFCGVLLFFFVPESFWDRSPVPKIRHTSKNTSRLSFLSAFRSQKPAPDTRLDKQADGVLDNINEEKAMPPTTSNRPTRPAIIHRPSTTRNLHVGFAKYEHENSQGNKDSEDSTTPADMGVAPVQATHSGKQLRLGLPTRSANTEKFLNQSPSNTTGVQSTNGNTWWSQQAELLLLHSYIISIRPGMTMSKGQARTT